METGGSNKFREYQMQYEKEQQELQKYSTKLSEFTNQVGQQDNEPQVQLKKVKQFMPSSQANKANTFGIVT